MRALPTEGQEKEVQSRQRNLDKWLTECGISGTLHGVTWRVKRREGTQQDAEEPLVRAWDALKGWLCDPKDGSINVLSPIVDLYSGHET